jgi:hypothetical protein
MRYFTYALTVSFFIISIVSAAQAIPVKVVQENGKYQLYRGGEPYYIKGAGGKDHLDYLIYLGGNSIRTWSPDDAQEVLDKAHKKGLTVMMGLWVQHERHGFNYDDTLAVRKQLEHFTEVVTRFKDHPALLLWGIGNEVNLFYSNYKVWDAVQDIAAMIHRVDPNHPTSTVTAGLDSMEVFLVKDRAPDIDIFGVNTYGDLHQVPGNIRKFGWEGPHIISEWGPTGHWEVAKTEWGAPIEQTSTEKAQIVKKRFIEYIEKDEDRCIGSYIFLWGQKQETTSTWYGLFTEEGNPTEPLEQVYIAWQKKQPNFASPSIQSVQLEGKKMTDNIYLKAEDKFTAEVNYTSTSSNPVKIEWVIYPESDVVSAGGDYEKGIQPVYGLIKGRKKPKITFKAPEKEGAYRLFVFITAKNKMTSYANIPFYVNPRKAEDPPAQNIRFKTKTLEITRN